MDIMNSKKTLLSLINGGAILGSASSGQTVKFQYATTIAKAAASQTEGAITFAAGANGSGAIYVNQTLVSSKILAVDWAASATKDHSQNTITVTYISNESGHVGEEVTKTLNVIDEAGLKAYFTGSKTIDISTGGIYEVKTDNATILVDANDGLKSGLNMVLLLLCVTTTTLF